MGIVKCVESKALRGKLLKKPTEAMNEGEVGKSPKLPCYTSNLLLPKQKKLGNKFMII